MPNWCDNRMIVTGPEDRVDEFVQLAEGPMHQYKEEDTASEEAKYELLSLHQVVPLPDKALAGPYDPVGYAAEHEAWGVKWGVRGAEREYDAGEGWTEYRFATAWAPPLEFVRRASKRYPTLMFDLRYEEDGVDIFGRSLIQNGIVIRDVQWEPGDGEALRGAIAERTAGAFRLDLLPKSSLLLIENMDAGKLCAIGKQIQERYEIAAAVADKLANTGWECRLRDVSELICQHSDVTTHEIMKQRLAEAGVEWTLCI